VPSPLPQSATHAASSHGQRGTLKILGAHSTAISATLNKRPAVADDSSRAPKKLKQGGNGDADTLPSLLSRMGGANTHDSRIKSNVQQDPIVSPKLPEAGEISTGGFSIRGAAKAERRLESSPSSLLERIKGMSTGEDEWESKKRKRGRAR